MDNFYLKINKANTLSINLWPFDEKDLSNLFPLESVIRVKSASIQLFGSDDASSDYDVNLNAKIFYNFTRLYQLHNLFELPFEYSIFELDIDIRSPNTMNEVSVFIDFNLAIFEINIHDEVLVKNICRFLSKEKSDYIFSLITSNIDQYVCFKTQSDGKISYEIINQPKDFGTLFDDTSNVSD